MRVRPARAAAAVVLTLVLLTPVTYAAQLSMQEIPLPLDDTYSRLSDDARKGDSGFSGFYRYVFITDDDKESPSDKLTVSENIQDGNIEIIYMTVKS
jgi:hypothetical protein